MKKGSSFRLLTEEERELGKVILKRLGTYGSIQPLFYKCLDKAEVSMVVDEEKKFTTCILRPFTTNKSRLFLGISKRATYSNNNYDRYNEKVGSTIALSRAVKNWFHENNSFVF